VGNEDNPPSAYAKRVGERLRAIRKQKELSLQDVEAASQEEFKASVLGAYERGERAISVPRLQRLARFYSVPVDHLLPTDPPAGHEEVIDLQELALTDAQRQGEHRTLEHEERVRIDLHRLGDLDGPERDLLTRYVTQIQRERQDYNGRVLTIRRDDLRVIASVLDMTPDLLRRRLDDLGVRLPS
jgi:transcriptional regulator with XRE-family HTH domain